MQESESQDGVSQELRVFAEHSERVLQGECVIRNIAAAPGAFWGLSCSRHTDKQADWQELDRNRADQLCSSSANLRAGETADAARCGGKGGETALIRGRRRKKRKKKENKACFFIYAAIMTCRKKRKKSWNVFKHQTLTRTCLTNTALTQRVKMQQQPVSTRAADCFKKSQWTVMQFV